MTSKPASRLQQTATSRRSLRAPTARSLDRRTTSLICDCVWGGRGGYVWVHGVCKGALEGRTTSLICKYAGCERGRVCWLCRGLR